jgi:UDP-glucose 4-epimerase
MKIIITGGAGFIGSHIAEKLSKKNKVIILDNLTTGRIKNIDSFKNKIIFKKVDLSKKPSSWIKIFKNVDKVFHLAALADIVPSIQQPNEYYDSNVTGTLNVLEACRKYKVKKIVYAASSSCYGIANQIPTNEKAPISPQYPYALTKQLGESLILHWSKIYKINSTSLRLFNVYGSRSRTSGTYGAMFGVFFAQKLAGKPFTVVGDGSQKRDFTYVSDVVDAFIKASNSRKSGDIYNVGSGKAVSVNYIVKLLKGKKIFIKKRPGEPDITFADIKKIKKMLNWSPKISIENGIKKIMEEHINYWKEAPVWTPKKIDKATKLWFKYLK